MSERLALVRKSDEVVLTAVPAGRRIEQRDPKIGPVLRVDGAAAGWEDDAYRIVAVEPLTVPAGKQVSGEKTLAYDPATDKAVESAPLEDVPPPPPEPTPAEKLAGLAADYGLTVDDLKAELGIAAR